MKNVITNNDESSKDNKISIGEQQTVNVIPRAVTVKEAQLIKISLNDVPQKYFVNHYGTQIFEVAINKTNDNIEREVIHLSAKTQSSKRAVSQALEYLESSKTIQQIRKELDTNTGRVLI